MTKPKPSDPTRIGESALESRLRNCVPVANALPMAELMYRAGYDAAKSAQMPLQKSWRGFASGIFSGAMAAGLVWICCALATGTPDQEVKPSLMAGNAIHSDTSIHDIGELGMPRSSTVAVASVPLDLEQQLFRDSLSQVAKQQWDQRRQVERTRWISLRSSERAEVNTSNSNTESERSLWLLRNKSDSYLGL